MLLLLAGGMVTHNAQGQAQTLGDSYVFFVDRANPDLEAVVNSVVADDPKGSNTRVLRVSNGDFAFHAFRFVEAGQGTPRDMTANRNAGNVLHFRILVDPRNASSGGNVNNLAIMLEDFDDGASNFPFRLRWTIPDTMRNGEWHEVSLTLPPATYNELEAAKTANTITPLEKNWIYGGTWSSRISKDPQEDPLFPWGGPIGTDLLGPATPQQYPNGQWTNSIWTWSEWEWDNVWALGVFFDWGSAGGDGGPIYLDDVYIGPANMDLAGILPPEMPPPAVSGVNFSVDGNQHVISWTHDATATDISQYKVYSSHNPITNVKAQGVGLLKTVGAGDDGGNHVVRAQGDLPHASIGSTIYYGVTSLNGEGLENKDISNSSASLAATSYSPVVVQLTSHQAATIKANIAAGNAVGSGFPSGTVPFTVNQAHSIRTVGGDSPSDSDLSGSFLVGYSDANELYIYAEVTDDQVEISGAGDPQTGTWADDTIEFLWGNYDVREAGGSIMGGTPHPDRKRGDYPDYQIRISAHGTAASAVVKNISDLPGGSLDPTNKLDSGSGAYAPMDGGYKILIVLPVSEFNDPIDRENAFPGAHEIRYSPMSITLNDRDGGNRGHQITWSLRADEGGDSVWRVPTQWQTVAMVGSNYTADAPPADPEGIPPAHTKIIHMDGGPLTVDLDATFGKSADADWSVHHYVIDDGATVNEPGATFVVAGHGWVQLDEGMLTITPTGAGGVKFAVQPGTDDPQPLKVEIMSSNAPVVSAVSSGTGYNANANGYAEIVNLKLGKETSKELELFDRFSDVNDIILSYNHSDLQPLVTNPDVVTATFSGSKLTIALTDKARGGDASDVWIYAVDPAGEYARLRIGVNITSATGPYVVSALDDVIIREDDDTDTKVYLFGTFADGDGQALAYEVIVNDDAKVEIGANPKIVITPIMRTEIHDLANVGPNSTGDIVIRPRATGSVSFTVKASAGGETAEDVFNLIIVSTDAPEIKTQIPDQELEADAGAMTIDLTDVDPEKEGAQPAFEDPDGGAMTYSATSKNANVVRASARGTVLTLTPIFGPGGHTYVTVSATDADGETFSQTFKVTVNGASKPIINPQVAPILGVGITLNTGDDPLVLDLKALPNPLSPGESLGALFIDPNANPSDPLPGGLLYSMAVEDVEAPHRYDALSSENSVVTSAMRITLDPVTTILTIVPTAANYANITIRAVDREENKISATMKVTVASDVDTEDSELPTEVSLSQNYPNPFNPQTTIDYSLPKASDVSLVVYDMLGREVGVLVDGLQTAGQHTVRFNADHLPNGTYVYRLAAEDKTITRTMVLLK